MHCALWPGTRWRALLPRWRLIGLGLGALKLCVMWLVYRLFEIFIWKKKKNERCWEMYNISILTNLSITVLFSQTATSCSGGRGHPSRSKGDISWDPKASQLYGMSPVERRVVGIPVCTMFKTVQRRVTQQFVEVRKTIFFKVLERKGASCTPVVSIRETTPASRGRVHLEG